MSHFCRQIQGEFFFLQLADRVSQTLPPGEQLSGGLTNGGQQRRELNS